MDLEFESDSTISMVWRLKQCESSVEIGNDGLGKVTVDDLIV